MGGQFYAKLPKIISLSFVVIYTIMYVCCIVLGFLFVDFDAFIITFPLYSTWVDCKVCLSCTGVYFLCGRLNLNESHYLKLVLQQHFFVLSCFSHPYLEEDVRGNQVLWF